MYKCKFKKIVAIILVLGLIFSLTPPVDAKRNKGRKAGRRINNIVNIVRTLREIRRLTRPPAASTDCKFEKGDVILRRMDLDEVRAWISATALLVNPGLAVVLWRFTSQLSLAGHSGLYMEWEPDEKSDPAIKKNHKTIESHAQGPDYDNFENFVKIKHFWGVRTSNRLDDEDRRDIVGAAKSQISEDIGYDFFSDYKSPGKSFRCDGLIEWAYEKVGIDIIQNDWWCVKKGHNLLCARKQLDALDAQNNALFPVLAFGSKEKPDEPIYIDDEPVPLEDGKYKVHGDKVEVKIYASDIDDNNDGSGITRLELWVGEPDDTPRNMPGFRIMSDEDDKDYPDWHDYTYYWDTTKKDEQGDPLFPNGDYTLKAIAFDQAGNTKETYINVKIEELPYYFHVQLSPEYVETGSPSSQTQTFTIKVQCYNYGTSVNPPPEGMVNKLSGTESWVKKADGEWEKEKINPDCQPPEAGWAKSDYTGEVSLGILETQGYELYAGGEKLETLELADGAGTISGVVIKAKDGDISNDRLFLIISASDGAGSGNNALMVNPILVSVSIYDDDQSRTSPVGKAIYVNDSGEDASAERVWTKALDSWNDEEWWYYPNFIVSFWNQIIFFSKEGADLYECGIWADKAKLTVDLTGYDPADYLSAKLVVKPTIEGTPPTYKYYNEQGWTEDEYNTLKDMKSELGKVWISTEYYAPTYTPLRLDNPPHPIPPEYMTTRINGYRARFYIVLIPKMP